MLRRVEERRLHRSGKTDSSPCRSRPDAIHRQSNVLDTYQVNLLLRNTLGSHFNLREHLLRVLDACATGGTNGGGGNCPAYTFGKKSSQEMALRDEREKHTSPLPDHETCGLAPINRARKKFRRFSNPRLNLREAERTTFWGAAEFISNPLVVIFLSTKFTHGWKRWAGKKVGASMARRRPSLAAQ